MDYSTTGTDRLLAGFAAFVFAWPTLFFAWYTVRLIYMTMIMPSEDIAPRMGRGMWIGAVAFPLVAAICGFLCWYFLKRAIKGFR